MQAAQPWYTDVREKLLDPKTESWFLKFDPKAKGNYTVPQCDKSFTPPRCSDLYHVRAPAQTPSLSLSLPPPRPTIFRHARLVIVPEPRGPTVLVCVFTRMC